MEGKAPLVVAHRGSNADEPEHSLASYLLAVQEGADAVECDVRLTADGELVLVHDRRIDRTSSGRGVVSAMTLAELSEHDFSVGESWQQLEREPNPARSAVLTLPTMLEAILDASPTMQFSIETKHPIRYGKYVEEELLSTLERFGLAHPKSPEESRVRVMSFSQLAVRRMRRLLPELPSVLLMERIPRRRRDGSLPGTTQVAGICIDRLHDMPDYVQRVHDRGGEVHVWVVDTPDDVRLCLDLGVDAIISNRPAMVRAVLLANR